MNTDRDWKQKADYPLLYIGHVLHGDGQIHMFTVKQAQYLMYMLGDCLKILLMSL